MRMNVKVQRLAQSVALGALLVAASADGQTATQFCSGYSSPGTITITNTFSYPVGQQCVGLIWGPAVPAGWTITNVRGNGGGPELGWDGYILFTAYTIPKPVVMLYDVVIPAGETGPKNIQADVYYDLGPGLINIRATPDPLSIERLDRTLEIVSLCGTGRPSSGVYTNLVGTSLSLSMSETGNVGPTQYVCTGWSMTGNEPASGATTNFTMTVADNAVLTWNWLQTNIAPTVTNELQIVCYRTPQFSPLANKVTEADLLAQVNDPDSGDTLTLTSVNTNGLKGVLVGSGGILTYTPPKQTDSIIDVFTYTVTDSKGASAVGTVKVRVTYGGTMIRAF